MLPVVDRTAIRPSRWVEPRDEPVEPRVKFAMPSDAISHAFRYGGSSSPARAAGLPRPRPRAGTGDVVRPVAAGAPASRVEPMPTVADPPDDLGGHPRHEGVGGDVLRHDGPRCDHRPPANRNPAENRRVRTNRGPVLDPGRDDLPVRRVRPRVQVVREARVGADEHPVPDRHSVVDRREVLDLAPVPEDDVRIDVRVLPDPAVPADPGALPDLDPVPDLRAIADGGLRGDVRGRVDLCRNPNHLLKSRMCRARAGSAASCCSSALYRAHSRWSARATYAASYTVRPVRYAVRTASATRSGLAGSRAIWRAVISRPAASTRSAPIRGSYRRALRTSYTRRVGAARRT